MSVFAHLDIDDARRLSYPCAPPRRRLLPKARRANRGDRPLCRSLSFGGLAEDACFWGQSGDRRNVGEYPLLTQKRFLT